MTLRRIALVASALALAACQNHHQTTAPAADGQAQPTATAPSEAQRTLEMERTAAEATQRLEAAQQRPLTEVQAEDAYRQFEAERQKLNQQAEGSTVQPADGSTVQPVDGFEPAPPPPPPPQ